MKLGYISVIVVDQGRQLYSLSVNRLFLASGKELVKVVNRQARLNEVGLYISDCS